MKIPVFLLRGCLVGLVSLTTPSTCLADIDQNANGLSDVWEMRFGPTAFLPSLDPDGDGVSNLHESLAGTNPLEGASRLDLSMIFKPAEVQVTLPGEAGKRYTVSATASLGANSWSTTAPFAGQGIPITFAYPTTNQTRQFFRANVGNQTTTSGMVNDWEKIQLGFNPKTLRTDRYEATDETRILAGLAIATPAVTLGVVDEQMQADWASHGVIAIRRTTASLKPLTVNFTISGNAVRGTDYTVAAGNSITLPMGVREARLSFLPANPSLATARTITVTLATGSGYTTTGSAATLTLRPAGGPSPKAAARFLLQAAYGPDSSPTPSALPPNVSALMAQGYPAWIEEQFARPLGLLQPYVDWRLANGMPTYTDSKPVAYWNRILGTRIHPGAPVQTPDLLRQRMAFALSQIFVISDRVDELMLTPQGMLNFYDIFVRHGFGNYRDVLREVALHPCMGIYLSHLKNRKPDPANNIFPDENFARENMQLFSIGLWELNADGTRQLTAGGQPIPTYGNTQITHFARVFTGLSYDNDDFEYGSAVYTSAMRGYDAKHDLAPKTLLRGVTLPARTASAGNTGTATMLDVNAAIDNLFNHPNTGPFICRQLIQRFTSSNPSPAYLGAVAAAFANNGSGVRGDFKAILRAILLHPEARDIPITSLPFQGKMREPYLHIANLAFALKASSPSGIYDLNYLDVPLAQQVLGAPSVFNFYRPGYAPAGPISDAGLTAPEFQILNSITVLARANYFNGCVNGSFLRWGADNLNDDTRADLTPEVALASDPDALLRRLNLSLAAGALSPPELQIIREAITRIDSSVTSAWALERVRAAVWLITNSPEAAVVR